MLQALAPNSALVFDTAPRRCVPSTAPHKRESRDRMTRRGWQLTRYPAWSESHFLLDNHGASGHTTWANAVTAGVAAHAAAGVAVVSFAARLTGRERDPISVHLRDRISVHCLEGHLLARRLRNTGRQGSSGCRC